MLDDRYNVGKDLLYKANVHVGGPTARGVTWQIVVQESPIALALFSRHIDEIADAMLRYCGRSVTPCIGVFDVGGSASRIEATGLDEALAFVRSRRLRRRDAPVPSATDLSDD